LGVRRRVGSCVLGHGVSIKRINRLLPRMPERGDINAIDGKVFRKYNGSYWVKIYDPCFTPDKLEDNFDDAIINTSGREPYTKNNTIANDIKKNLPNLLWVIPGKVAVVVEIDEDSNYNNETSYEVKKIIDQNKAIRMLEGCENMRVCTIRVNTGAYDGGDITQKDRVDNVVRLLHFILDVYADEIEGEDDDENNTNPLKAIVTPYHSDNDENKQKVTDTVEFCYYHSKSWNHIDAHKLEFHCEELYLHEPWEWNSHEYRAYYYRKTIERRREYSLKYHWKKWGVTGNIDTIYGRWLNATKCEVCGVKFEDTLSIKCMDHDHDTGEFRHILCSSCNNHDYFKKVLAMKSPENSNRP